jgi:hypothetical protein
MKTEYLLRNETSTALPYFLVIWGPNSSDPGEPIFAVECGDNALAVEVAMTSLVASANAAGGALLDGLIGKEVVLNDLPLLDHLVKSGREAYLAPEKFTADDVDRAMSNVFSGGPTELSMWSAEAAIDVLKANWKTALSDGSKIADLVSDVDQVIKHLLDFKFLCADKPERFPIEGYSDFIKQEREKIAQKHFDSYEFNMSLEHEEANWRYDGPNRLMKISEFVREDQDRVRAVFHAVFTPNSLVLEECFALDLHTGLMI